MKNLRNLMKQDNTQGLNTGVSTVRRMTPESKRRWSQTCRDKSVHNKKVTLPKPPWDKELEGLGEDNE